MGDLNGQTVILDCGEGAAMGAISGLFRDYSRDSLWGHDREVDNITLTLRCDSPRFLANATWRHRTGAPTIFRGYLLDDLDFNVPFRKDLLQPREVAQFV